MVAPTPTAGLDRSPIELSQMVLCDKPVQKFAVQRFVRGCIESGHEKVF